MSETSRLLTPADLEQIAARGIEREEIERQLEIFAAPPAPLALDRPCRLDDGIRRLAPSEHGAQEELWERAAAAGRIGKFVPASGAATRMFAPLLAYLESDPGPAVDELRRRAEAGDRSAADLVALAQGLPRLALWPGLRDHLASHGAGAAELLAGGELREVFRALLEDGGLGLAGWPKGLIDFHLYTSGPRSAFEEHFTEAIDYLSTGAGVPARLHFTVNSRHVTDFETAFGAFQRRLQASRGVPLEVGLSVQDPTTDTLAVDLRNRPLRAEDGRLVFRPAGHGALIDNLERLGGDLVVIKNIDNIAPERLHPVAVRWKRLLTGYLLTLEAELFDLLRRLESGGGEEVEERARLFLTDRLGAAPPTAAGGAASRRRRLFDRLYRPLRVCGMVRNAGEPGGGPFWVRSPAGVASPQIVESSQVEFTSTEQREIWETSTHFNPVDLVCSLRDHRGRPYDLGRFVNPAASLIAVKRDGARELKALERPGLWNGAMAGWSTVFVEVPSDTFNPVKTLLDLLRPEHQA